MALKLAVSFTLGSGAAGSGNSRNSTFTKANHYPRAAAGQLAPRKRRQRIHD
jgi:hypothetical protein